jgi:hypothetical protein
VEGADVREVTWITVIAHAQCHIDLKGKEEPKILAGITAKEELYVNIVNHGH